MSRGEPPLSEEETTAPPAGRPWDSPFEEAPQLWLDLEMTGVDPEVDRICELAALRVERGEVVAKLVGLVRPGRPVGGSEQIHGLSDAELSGAPDLVSMASELADLAAGAILVGHNVRHDVAFLKSAAARGEAPPPPTSWLCTRRLARRALHRGSYALAAVCESLELPPPTHRAESDARAAGALLARLARDLRVSTARQLFEAQPVSGARGFRSDIRRCLEKAAVSGERVRFAYRSSGRGPFVDELTVTKLDPEHVDAQLHLKGLGKRLRGDRFLWAERCP